MKNLKTLKQLFTFTIEFQVKVKIWAWDSKEAFDILSSKHNPIIVHNLTISNN